MSTSVIAAEKVCCKCEISKPSSAFGRHARRPDGLRDHCRDCGRKPARTFNCQHCHSRQETRSRGHLPKICAECEATLSWCHGCSKAKPHSEFRAMAKARTGRQARCIECFDIYFEQPRIRMQRHRNHLRQRYGIDGEVFEQLLIEQGGCCGICDEQLTGAIAVDHDHETDAIRGLLCYRCNTGLGSLGDNVDGLMRAAAYLIAREDILGKVG